MYDNALLRERLLSILEVLERIPRRFAGINTPEVNAEELFGICRDDIPQLIDTVQQMIQEIDDGAA